VLVELEGCGLCGSDLPVWEGRPWFDYPREPGSPGHEGWGRIAAVGPDTQAPPPGTRVAALSYHAHADHDLADVDALVVLPEALDGRPFPGEALGCAMNVARRSEIRAGDTVAVVGSGFMGALLVALATGAGARTIALSRRPFARETALRMGAEHALALDEHALEAVLELTGGELCDVAVEATGRQEPLDLCGQLTRVRGRLVIAGYHQDGPRLIDMQLWNWRGLDVINAHERDRAVYRHGVERALAAILDGRLDPSPLYTHEFPLARADQAFRAASERPDGFLKALVVP
jgi:threonine dehydrogenase-like Zn-dependent dehydrogenase